jgi:outer membrane protein insertion porin family
LARIRTEKWYDINIGKKSQVQFERSPTSLMMIGLLILVLGTACANLGLTTAVWGQSLSNSASGSPSSTAGAADIGNHRSQEAVGRTEFAPSISRLSTLDSSISTRAADLLWEPRNGILTNNAKFSLEPTVESEAILAQKEDQQDEDKQEDYIPPGEIVIKLSSGFGFGSQIDPPTALNGLTRKSFVLPGSKSFNTLPVLLHFKQGLGDNQGLLLQLAGVDPQVFALDLSYTIAPKSLPGAFSANFIYQSTLHPAFEGGEVAVTLPRGGDPWVNGIGGGIEYSQTLVPNLDLAAGVNYQKVSVRSGMFSNEIEPVDEFGNPLTVSSKGQDDLLTLNLTTFYNNVNNLNYPDQGFRTFLAINQSIPVGEAKILSTLFEGSLTQFIPFGSGPKRSSLVLNFQGGTILGDAPPYGPLNLGGRNSVRGYGTGQIGTGKSFIEASAEYRLPIYLFRAFKQQNALVLSLFFDYANDLGTADEVIGEPAVVRDKPGDGFGYGLGFQWQGPVGLLRLELGLSNEGDFEIGFGGGSRF